MNNNRVCPFKEDSALVKKINYKEHKFLRKFITEQARETALTLRLQESTSGK